MTISGSERGLLKESLTTVSFGLIEQFRRTILHNHEYLNEKEEKMKGRLAWPIASNYQDRRGETSCSKPPVTLMAIVTGGGASTPHFNFHIVRAPRPVRRANSWWH